MEYVQRLNHFAAARTWRLDYDGITWSDDNGESGRITYLAVRAVRLRFEPSRTERGRYAMRIFAGREYLITNMNYRGLMDFVDESAQFRRFVMAFHECLRQENKNVTYKVGATHLAYMANLLITLFVMLILCVAVFYFVSVGLMWLVAKPAWHL